MKMQRILFLFIYYTFLKWLPPSYAKGGIFWKKLRGLVCSRIFLSSGSNINVERNATFGSGKNITIGDNSGIGENAIISGTIEIGNNVMMGRDVIVLTQNHRFDRIDIPMIEQGFQNEKKVIIGDDVWIGSRVIILPGVVIGNGAIVGAGAVVTREVGSFEIVGGNPARVIKKRNF